MYAQNHAENYIYLIKKKKKIDTICVTILLYNATDGEVNNTMISSSEIHR